jgi:hypothetical protein
VIAIDEEVTASTPTLRLSRRTPRKATVAAAHFTDRARATACRAVVRARREVDASAVAVGERSGATARTRSHVAELARCARAVTSAAVHRVEAGVSASAAARSKVGAARRLAGSGTANLRDPARISASPAMVRVARGTHTEAIASRLAGSARAPIRRRWASARRATEDHGGERDEQEPAHRSNYTALGRTGGGGPTSSTDQGRSVMATSPSKTPSNTW